MYYSVQYHRYEIYPLIWINFQNDRDKSKGGASRLQSPGTSASNVTINEAGIQGDREFWVAVWTQCNVPDSIVLVLRCVREIFECDNNFRWGWACYATVCVGISDYKCSCSRVGTSKWHAGGNTPICWTMNSKFIKSPVRYSFASQEIIFYTIFVRDCHAEKRDSSSMIAYVVLRFCTKSLSYFIYNLEWLWSPCFSTRNIHIKYRWRRPNGWLANRALCTWVTFDVMGLLYTLTQALPKGVYTYLSRKKYTCFISYQPVRTWSISQQIPRKFQQKGSSSENRKNDKCHKWYIWYVTFWKVRVNSPFSENSWWLKRHANA